MQISLQTAAKARSSAQEVGRHSLKIVKGDVAKNEVEGERFLRKGQKQ